MLLTSVASGCWSGLSAATAKSRHPVTRLVDSLPEGRSMPGARVSVRSWRSRQMAERSCIALG